MPLIDIDIDELIPPSLKGLLDHADQLVEAVLDDVANSALMKWRQLASRELHTSKAEYLDSLQDIEAREGERILSLVGWLAEAVETGLGAYDLKEILLARGARKSAAGFKYRPIPFRHATPGATTGQAGTAMGSQYGPARVGSLATPGALSRGQARELGRRVHREAKKLRGGARLRTGAGGAIKLHKRHSTDLFSGMVKRAQPKAGGGKQTSGYMTFRMVSDNPAVAVTGSGEKWLHPGIDAHNFADQVADHAAALVAPALHQAIRGALEG